MTTEITYKINDSKGGTFATVNTPDGTFNLKLVYHNGQDNRRVWEVKGTYPREKYMITYEGGRLFILRKGGDFEVGQTITHKAFGTGVVKSVNGNAVCVNFEKAGEKVMMKSILANFIV